MGLEWGAVRVHVLPVDKHHEEQDGDYDPEHELEFVVPNKIYIWDYLLAQSLSFVDVVWVGVQVLADELICKGPIELYGILQCVAVDPCDSNHQKHAHYVNEE